jgi:ketosteroid isomerase-like protein
MSQENVETLRTLYEAFNRRDWDAAFDRLDPDFQLRAIGGRTQLLSETFRGHDEVRSFFEDRIQPFDELTLEPEQFFDRGEKIAVFLRFRARPRDSSATIENRVGHLWTIGAGKLVRCQLFPEREQALEALERSEQSAPADS